MFTPGSKYLIAITGLSAVSLALYMLLVHPSAIGAVALIGLLTATSLLTGITLFTRDGHASEGETSAATLDTPTSSMWPLVGAAGFTLLLVGTITTPIVFILGIVAMLAALIEWTVQAWSERGSGDIAYNASIRQRLLNPIEYPLLAAIGIAVIIFSFSRVMLAINKDAGALTFILAASAISLVGLLISVRPQLKKSIVLTIAVVAAVGLVGAGIASMGVGMRDELVVAGQEDHYAHKECGAERSEHFDKGVSKTISAKSGADATIELIDGKLTAHAQGIEGLQDSITVRRSNPINIIFRNKDAGEFRLSAYLGKTKVADGVSEDLVTCTQLLPQGGEQWLTFKIAKPSIAEGPYTLTIPGLEGQSIVVVVP
ncbi:MAG: hypothetical protein WCI32_06545 [Actinomycetota bacterium]